MKQEYINLLSDIQEIGPVAFAQATQKENDAGLRMQMIALIANQFLQYRDMAERQNLIFREIGFIFQLQDLVSIVNEVNLFLPGLFNARRVNFWVLDNSSGVFHTFHNSFERKILINKGIVNEVFTKNGPLNVKNARHKPLLYRINAETLRDEPEYVESTLLLPIYVRNDELGERKKLKAVLEVSNSVQEFFGHDEEYLGIIVAEYIALFLEKYIQNQVYSYKLKYNQMVLQSFQKLCEAKQRAQFVREVQSAVHYIFGIQQSKFYFLENGNLVTYQGEKAESRSVFPLHYGLCGLVAAQNRGLIINDVKYSTVFNKLVDIQSILPIYTMPIQGEVVSEEK